MSAVPTDLQARVTVAIDQMLAALSELGDETLGRPCIVLCQNEQGGLAVFHAGAEMGDTPRLLRAAAAVMETEDPRVERDWRSRG